VIQELDQALQQLVMALLRVVGSYMSLQLFPSSFVD